MTNHIWDTIIVGGGAAGLSAAQALGRSLRRVLVIDSGSPRNRFAARMHNLLGHDGTPPEELIARGRDEAAGYGVEFRVAEIVAIRDLSSEVDGVEGEGAAPVLEVELAGGEAHAARSLIIASGVRDELPGIPGLAEHWGSGVLHCPYCHGWEVRGKRIGIVPSSPMAIHLAKLVRQLSDDLVLFANGLGGAEALSAEDAAGLLARGVRIVDSPVVEVFGDGSRISAVRTADGEEFPVDAVFANSKMVPRDGFAAGLGLDRAETPFGSFLAVDPMGRTSHPRIWAVGNVVAPAASVPMVMGAGTAAGAAVNMSLVEEDFALAAAASPGAADNTVIHPAQRPGAGHRPQAERHDHGAGASAEDPAVFWEALYSAEGPRWSGRPNAVLEQAIAGLSPGRSLDLGSGEGGDVVWLAGLGWDASGIELSPTAVARAREAAVERGVAERTRFIVGDLADWAEEPARVDGADEPFDLVTASFLQSPVELPRAGILAAAAGRTAPGGTLVVLAHAAAPPWASGHDGEFPSPASELEALRLDPAEWEVRVADVIRREAEGPDGETAVLEDSLVVARRR